MKIKDKSGYIYMLVCTN